MVTYQVREFRGLQVAYVDTMDVRVGDQIVCMLSDATATVTVTGWTDRELDLRWPGHANPVHRTFTYTSAPWWVDKAMMTHGLAGRTHIVAR